VTEEKRVKGYKHLVTMDGRCGGRVTIEGRRMEPSAIVSMVKYAKVTRKDIAELGITDAQYNDCIKFIEERNKKNKHT